MNHRIKNFHDATELDKQLCPYEKISIFLTFIDMFPVLASLHYAFIELTEHFLMQYSSFLRLVRFHDRSYRYQNLQNISIHGDSK